MESLKKSFCYPKLYEKRCDKCKGSGLYFYKKPQLCIHCNGKNCFRCQNIGGVKTYQDCSPCSGRGSIYYDTNKKEIDIDIYEWRLS